MRGNLLLFILVMFSIKACYSQQIPQYSQWSMHQFAGNPAHAGIKKCIDLHTLYRMQWIGAPRSGFLTVSVPLNSKRKQYLSARHGTGFKFETDQIGQFNMNRFNFAYAAHFNFDRDNRLSLGLYGGVIQMGYNPTTIQTADPDPAAMSQGSFLAPDASFGAWFNAENYYIGLSLQNLFPSKWENIGINSRSRFHAALNAGYRMPVSEGITFLPAINVKIPPKGPLAVDLNLHLDFKNVLGIGVGYRNTDAMIAFLSVKIKDQFAVVYSFDYTLSDIQLGAQNTHEVSLRFTSCKRDRANPAGCALFE